MLKYIYSIRDYKVGYMNLVIEDNDSVAIRNLKQALRSPDSLMYNEPKDFALFRHGTYNTDDGIIDPNEPVLVAEVYNLICDLRNEVSLDVLPEKR